MPLDNQKEFWIVHLGGLGDWILAWPAILCLRRLLPDHRFVGIGRLGLLRLAVRFGLIDRAIDAEAREWTGFWSGRELPRGAGGPDGAAMWLADSEPVGRLLAQRASLPVAVVDPRLPVGRIHAARHACESIRRFLPIEVPEDLTAGFPDHASLGRRAFIHPGSGGLKKCHSPEFYRGIADVLRGRGFERPVVLLGPAEVERGWTERFDGMERVTPDSATGLADRLSNAALYLGNDSGPSHLAAFMGIPSLVFYRSTDPKVWGALGRRTRWIAAPDEQEAGTLFKSALDGFLRNPA
jgi:heptosyltransferase III